MKKFTAALCCLVMIILLAACAGIGSGGTTASPSPSGGALKPSEYGDSDFDTSGSIVIATEYEIYGSDAPEISYTIKNNTSAELVYGVQYAVEIYLDGKWYQVPFPDNTAWIDIGIILKANDTNTDSFKFSALDYTITDGRYRLIKEIGGKRYFAEFQVGKSPITAETPYGYQALEKLPKEYSSEEAAANGDIVITNNDIKNNGKLTAFIKKVDANMPAMARIVQYTIEGDPIITDYIFNGDHRGNFLCRHDNSRDRFGADTAITDKTYSFFITDGTYIYLSNCASWELTKTYTAADTAQIPWAANLSDIAEMTVLAEKMTKERLERNTARFKVYAPDGRQNVTLYGEDLSYGYEGLTSSEMRQVSDPDKIAVKITDVFWLSDKTFVLVCDTATDGIKYYDVVSSETLKSGYGTDYKVADGVFEIIK